MDEIDDLVAELESAETRLEWLDDLIRLALDRRISNEFLGSVFRYRLSIQYDGSGA